MAAPQVQLQSRAQLARNLQSIEEQNRHGELARPFCAICRRKFTSIKQLDQHVMHSDYHRHQLELSMQDNNHKREEIRQSMHESKMEMRGIEIELANAPVLGAPPDKLNRQQTLQRALKQLEREFGCRQEHTEMIIQNNIEEKELLEGSVLNQRFPDLAREIKLAEDVMDGKVGPGGEKEIPQESLKRSAGSTTLYTQELKKRRTTTGDVAGRSGGIANPTLRYSEKGVGLGCLELKAGVCTWQGAKDFQEDRFLFDQIFYGPQGEKIMGYACFDGHSGHLCADWMVQNFPQHLQRALSKDPNNPKQHLTEEFLRMAVHNAFMSADGEFCQLATPSKWMDGSTGVMAFIWECKPADLSTCEHSKTTTPNMQEKMDPVSTMRLMVANVGDSRGVLVQKKGKLLSASNQKQYQLLGPTHGLRLSEDHKPDRPDEKIRIEKANGIVNESGGCPRVFTDGPLWIGDRHVQWGLAVSRSFGDLPLKNSALFGGDPKVGYLVSAVPEITTWTIVPGRDLMIILACDGIWDVMTDAESANLASGSYRAATENRDDRTYNTFATSQGVIVPHVRCPEAQAARGLVRESFQRQSMDNLTAVCISITPTDSWWMKRAEEK